MINEREYLTKKVFKSFSYEIFQFLNKEEKTRLSMTNKFFNDLVDCHGLFGDSIKSLNDLFSSNIEIDESTDFKVDEKPKSKFCMLYYI